MKGEHWLELKRLRRFSLLYLIVPALIACAQDNIADLKAFVITVKAREKGSIPPLPEMKTFETFVFEPEGLRDPFAPTETAGAEPELDVADGVRPDAYRQKEELESFSLDSLRMVGTLTMYGTLWGLVKTADGTIHRVRTGNYMGQNHGKITRILPERIELLEILPDSPGSWLERQASLALTG